MRSITLTHELRGDVDAFWRAFFDRAFNEELYQRVLGFPRYETLALDERDGELHRRTQVTPKLDAPGPVAKALGASFSYEEDGTFDARAKVFRWRTIPSALADKVKTEGVLRTEPAGDGKFRRIVELSYEAKVFGIGGIIESVLEKNLRRGWEDSVGFTQQWLDRTGAR